MAEETIEARLSALESKVASLETGSTSSASLASDVAALKTALHSIGSATPLGGSDGGANYVAWRKANPQAKPAAAAAKAKAAK